MMMTMLNANPKLAHFALRAASELSASPEWQKEVKRQSTQLRAVLSATVTLSISSSSSSLGASNTNTATMGTRYAQRYRDTYVAHLYAAHFPAVFMQEIVRDVKIPRGGAGGGGDNLSRAGDATSSLFSPVRWASTRRAVSTRLRRMAQRLTTELTVWNHAHAVTQVTLGFMSLMALVEQSRLGAARDAVFWACVAVSAEHRRAVARCRGWGGDGAGGGGGSAGKKEKTWEAVAARSYRRWRAAAAAAAALAPRRSGSGSGSGIESGSGGVESAPDQAEVGLSTADAAAGAEAAAEIEKTVDDDSCGAAREE